MKCDVALPSATQNEIEADDAKNLVKSGCKYVFEGANMPSNNAAIEIFKANNVVYFPAKVSFVTVYFPAKVSFVEKNALHFSDQLGDSFKIEMFREWEFHRRLRSALSCKPKYTGYFRFDFA